MNAPYQVAVTSFEHGESLVRRGEFALAFERFKESAAQFQKLGARLDAERALMEAERTRERMGAWAVAPAPSINLIPPDAAPLIMQVLNAASGRERLLRELMFAAKNALAAEGAIIFAVDDDGQLYAQASIDLDEAGRERAAKAVARLGPETRFDTGNVATRAAWQHIPSTYVVCTDDRAVSPPDS